MNNKEKSIELLKNWMKSAQKDIFDVEGRSDLKYYGDGSNGWGVQTNQKAFAAIAVLSRYDSTYKELALSLLRYSLATHVSGDFHLTDGDDRKWGHTWISVLGVERMMHGVDAIRDSFTKADEEDLRRMILSEADYILEEYTLVAGLVENNKPESNFWNGAIMCRAALMYPDCPNYNAYIARSEEFFVNSISVPSDETSDRQYNGRKVREMFVGANFFQSYSLDHHGYMNLGYMVITLSGLAMLHFSAKAAGKQLPSAAYHNFEHLWRLVKALIFPDGRLNRIGGDTRIRYCYCQDYLMPVLLLASDCLGEDTYGLEGSWLDIVSKEVAHNGDNTFLSDRCEIFIERSPLYFTRLESDRAVTIAFNLYYRELLERSGSCGGYEVDDDWKKPLNTWEDEYHGSYFVKSNNRVAAFTWVAGDGPQGECVNPADSSMAEWQKNMTSDFCGNGLINYAVILEHNGRLIDGGFVTVGRYVEHTQFLLEEQVDEEDTIRNSIAFVALPDDATVVSLQYADAYKTCHILSSKGLRVNIPNDLFNNFKRDYVETENHVTIDDCMAVSVIYGGKPQILKPEYRQIGLKESKPHVSNVVTRKRGMLHCDEICVQVNDTPRVCKKGECVLDFGAAVTVGEGNIKPVNAEKLDINGTLIRCAKVTGKNGVDYAFVANFADFEQVVNVLGIDVLLKPCAAELIEL